jgi:hypothetical protein
MFQRNIWPPFSGLKNSGARHLCESRWWEDQILHGKSQFETSLIERHSLKASHHIVGMDAIENTALPSNGHAVPLL